MSQLQHILIILLKKIEDLLLKQCYMEGKSDLLDWDQSEFLKGISL